MERARYQFDKNRSRLVFLSFAIVALAMFRFLRSGGLEFRILFFVLWSIFAFLSLYGLKNYIRHFKRNKLFLSHGIAAALIQATAVLHVIDFVLGNELLSGGYTFGRRLVWFQCLTAFLVSMPATFARFAEQADPRVGRGKKFPGVEYWAIFLFCSLYPVQLYVVDNIDAFSIGLTVQIALIALVIPAVIFLGLWFYLRPFISEAHYFLSNLGLALVVLVAYLRPFIGEILLDLEEALGFSIGFLLFTAALLILLTAIGVKFRKHLGMFLLLLLGLSYAHLAFVYFTARESDTLQGGSSSTPGLEITARPNIYALFVDGYQNAVGLRHMGLGDLSYGPELGEKGFTVYEEAVSNYKPSVPSLLSFFNVSHHHYDYTSEWLEVISGKNHLFDVLESNGYRSMAIHPSDVFLQGNCNSDYCFPAPSIFGQVGFVLAETIFFQKNFYKRMDLGMGRYQKRFHEILSDSSRPFVVYTHVLLPSHGPRGCRDIQTEINKYGEELLRANQWIESVTTKIASSDPSAIVLLLGDHGPFLADNCTWSDPDVNSSRSIIDNLGILMAVRWPADYDHRYDSDIHSLLDLSWYLLQYLSGDALEAEDKPASDSFLESNGRIYRVIHDGKVLGQPEVVETSIDPGP